MHPVEIADGNDWLVKWLGDKIEITINDHGVSGITGFANTFLVLFLSGDGRHYGIDNLKLYIIQI